MFPINLANEEMKAFVHSAFFSVLLINVAISQSLPVGFPLAEDILRRKQISGDFDSTASFSTRPFTLNSQFLIYGADTVRLYKSVLEKKLVSVWLLPVQVNAEYNTHYPFGWNNGSMIRSRGMQTLISAGGYVKAGPLSIQFRPEFVFAENKQYETFPESHPQSWWNTRISLFWNYIDYPEYFGSNVYSWFNWGQSFLKLSFGPVDLAISNENLWWGPGRFQSLIMTNNAAGFEHLTIKTNRAIRTPIGYFNGQLLVGKLDPSGFPPSSHKDPALLSRFNNKRNDWRYLSAINLSFKPRGLENLEVGFIRSLQQYFQTTRETGEYFPVFINPSRSGVGGGPDELDQQASLYSRIVLPEAKAELYIEAGRNDSPWDLRDFLMSPEHSMAFIFGFSKIFELNDFSFESNVEYFKSQRSGTYLLRAEPPWYRNSLVPHGYSHHGEVVGAGLIPGSNSLHVRLNAVRAFNSVGLSFDRILNDLDYYQTVANRISQAKPWTDYAFGLNHSRKINNLLLSASFSFVRSLNYQWQYELVNETPDVFEGVDRSNFYVNLKSAYTF